MNRPSSSLNGSGRERYSSNKVGSAFLRVVRVLRILHDGRIGAPVYRLASKYLAVSRRCLHPCLLHGSVCHQCRCKSGEGGHEGQLRQLRRRAECPLPSRAQNLRILVHKRSQQKSRIREDADAFAKQIVDNGFNRVLAHDALDIGVGYEHAGVKAVASLRKPFAGRRPKDDANGVA